MKQLKLREHVKLGSIVKLILSEKSPCLEFFWFVFSPTCTQYGEILHTSPHSVQMRENTDQKTSEYRHFSRSAKYRNEVRSVVTLVDMKCLWYTKPVGLHVNNLHGHKSTKGREGKLVQNHKTAFICDAFS